MTRSAARRRPSRTQVPRRDALAVRPLQGLETQLREPGLDVGRRHGADARGAMDMRASLPEASARTRPRAERRSGRRPTRAPSRTLASIRAGGSSVRRGAPPSPPPGLCSTVPPDLTTRFAKSAERTRSPTLTLRPSAHAARDDRLLADDRDARCSAGPAPAGSACRSRARRRRSPPGRPRPPCRGSRGRRPRRTGSTVSNITIESRTTAPTSTRTPGDRTLLTTVPLITQPCEIRLRWTCAVGPDLGRRPLLGPGVDQPVACRTGRARVRPRGAPCWPPSTTGSCPTSCQ